MLSRLSLFLFLCKFLTLVSGYIVESLIKFFCCQNKKASLYLLCYKNNEHADLTLCDITYQ